MININALPTVELVALYNKLTGKTIKKFSSRAAGELQVERLLKDKKPEAPTPIPAPVSKIIIKEIGKRESYENRIIEILVKENPKREGSLAHNKFQLLIEMNGKTIGNFREQEGKHPKLDKEAGWPSTELRWALKLGLAKVTAQDKITKAA